MTTGNRHQATGSSNKPRIVGVLACVLLLALCSSAEAQPQKKVPRIGYLGADPRATPRGTFLQGLRDFGYVEGQSIQIEWRFTENTPDRFPEFAAELARLKVDAIVAGYSGAVPILHHTTSTIPIVMTNYAGDPVADGLVTSYAKPGGNITGVISLAPELSGKQLELLKETLIKLSRLAVLWDPDDSGSRLQWQLLQLQRTASESTFYHWRLRHRPRSTKRLKTRSGYQ